MDWERLVKILIVLTILFGGFLAGAGYERALKNAEIAQLKQAYAEANQAEQKRIVENFNAKQAELEKALSDARNRESDARAESMQLHERIKQLSRKAKTPESRLTVRSLETLRRCETIVTRDTTIIEFCRAALQ